MQPEKETKEAGKRKGNGNRSNGNGNGKANRPRRKHPSLQALTHRNIESILELEEESRRAKPMLYRLVSRISRFCGTVAFLWWNLGFFAAWILLNQFVWRIDPYPFTFLLVLVSIEAIVLAIMILISQNMSAEVSEHRHHLDLQVNLLNEREMTALLRLATRMAEKLELPLESHEEVKALTERVDPGKVLHQIVEAEASHEERG
ncbi:hypothetical protein ASC78_09025 [Variovorax sp. Root318D1]|uniref:DUF1003 domain-containing protein n=1 Tax=Variovorax sp. Root318D1 TaxID=1736513 RepID=UPI0006FEBF61|nr:DUF1003 domain-containing protein [Variovorax sp. Root318D1]KQU84637.1 hypothetical protein ASC78_09025 [Variovorax sp. Root318D1]